MGRGRTTAGDPWRALEDELATTTIAQLADRAVAHGDLRAVAQLGDAQLDGAAHPAAYVPRTASSARAIDSSPELT